MFWSKIRHLFHEPHRTSSSRLSEYPPVLPSTAWNHNRFLLVGGGPTQKGCVEHWESHQYLSVTKPEIREVQFQVQLAGNDALKSTIMYSNAGRIHFRATVSSGDITFHLS